MMCAVPALRSLRAGLPDARVILVGLPSARALISRFSRYVDELVEFPGFPGIPEVPESVRALPAFLADMQARSLDLAIQMHGSGSSSNPFTVLLGARETAGLCLPGQYRPGEAFVPYPGDIHEIERLTAITSALGMPDTGTGLEWDVTEHDRRDLRTGTGGHLADAYAVIHPGADQKTRRWPPQRFGAVADRLSAEGLQVVLTGTAADAPLTAAVDASASAETLDLAGRTTIGALGALVAGSRLVVCDDTGISHLAAALRVASVVVFSASDPRRWAPLDAKLHLAVHGPLPTASCEVQRGVNERCLRDGCHELNGGACGDEVRFMEVEPVMEAVEQQLMREGAHVA